MPEQPRLDIVERQITVHHKVVVQKNLSGGQIICSTIVLIEGIRIDIHAYVYCSSVGADCETEIGLWVGRDDHPVVSQKARSSREEGSELLVSGLYFLGDHRVIVLMLSLT